MLRTLFVPRKWRSPAGNDSVRAAATLRARRPDRRPRRAGSTGAAPVRSMTVDGVPGSSPPSTANATPSRISAGTSSSRRGSRPPGGSRSSRRPDPRAARRPSPRVPAEHGNAHADRSGRARREPAEAPLRVRDDERERARQQGTRNRRRAATASLGMRRATPPRRAGEPRPSAVSPPVP